ncbi:MAG TPA: HEAT repeat domain-containing protein [Agitococcus sp.]|nr:HEAT repeat domain-containing protein [Agitococcus sp.]
MLTKEYVTHLKSTGTIADVVFENKENIGVINAILEKLGPLPKGFNVDFLYKLMRHHSASVRLNAVKNLAKISKDIDVNFLLDCFKLEKDTSVKREIVSAIGRQRNAKIRLYYLIC